MKTRARILVVDDNRTNRFVFEEGLKSQGHEVVTAVDGREALKILEPLLSQPADTKPAPDQIDLVLLDIMMPEIDGFEVLRRIRETRSRAGLPVIMATAKDTIDDIVTCLEAGANDYVTKPVSLPVLAARVNTQLALGSSHRALKEAHHSLVCSAKMETTAFFAAGVAHEIRNPLARIKMGLQALLKHELAARDEEIRKLTAIMGSSLKKADAVVQGLMKSAGEAHLELNETDLNGFIRESLPLIEGEAMEAGVTVRTDCDPGLPPVLASSPDLLLVFLNLLSNAIQAMAEGGELTIRTSTTTAEDVPQSEGSRTGNRIRKGDTVAILEVLDTGEGLSPEAVDRVFDPFFTTKPTGGGVGMGLTVAQKIVELHGGMLTLANRDHPPGCRAAVTLRLAGAFQSTA